jgi:quercetin dioxygenase-like cupin family protein
LGLFSTRKKLDSEYKLTYIIRNTGGDMVLLQKWLWLAALLAAAPGVLRAQQPADSVQAAQQVFTIGNCVNHFTMDKTIQTGVGYQYWFIDKNFLDGRTLKLSVVAPHGATHAPHRHAEDEFFFVLEGRAELILDGEAAQGGAYTSFYCPPNRLHGIRNAGDDTLKYLVIKKYNDVPK